MPSDEAREKTRIAPKPAGTATEAYASWSLEAIVETLYAITRWAFRPLALATFAALTLIGAVAFVVTPHAANAHVRGLAEQAAFWLAILVSIALHEAGHCTDTATFWW